MNKSTNDKNNTNAHLAYDRLLCGVIVDVTEGYYSDTIACGRKVKYKVKYRKATTGEFIEKNVCGLHFKQLEKNHAKLKNKMEYDNEFSYVELNTT